MLQPHRRTSPHALADCQDRLRTVIGVLAAASEEVIFTRADRDQALRNLAEAQTFNAEMVSLLSDEMRTMLTGIRGTAQLLIRRLDRADPINPMVVRDAAQRIMTVADRMAREIADLETLSGSAGELR